MKKTERLTHSLPLLPCDILKVRHSSEFLSYMAVFCLVETTATAAAVGTLRKTC